MAARIRRTPSHPARSPARKDAVDQEPLRQSALTLVEFLVAFMQVEVPASIKPETRDALAQLQAALDTFLSADPADGKEEAARERASELFWTAHERLMAGQHKKASELFAQALKEDPLHADTHTQLGVLAQREGKLEKAEGHFRQAEEGGQRWLIKEGDKIDWGFLENRPYLRAINALAFLARARGDWQKAARLHEQMLAMNPGDNQGVRSLLPEELHRAGQLERALEAYDRVAKEDPNVALGMGFARMEAKAPRQAVGEAFLLAFAANRYAALVVLGEKITMLKGFHGSNMEEPSWVEGYLPSLLALADRVPGALDELRFWWQAPAVRQWQGQIDETMRKLSTLKTGKARSAVVDEQFRLRDRQHSAKIARLVLGS